MAGIQPFLIGTKDSASLFLRFRDVWLVGTPKISGFGMWGTSDNN
jgi:hypothetical protein